MTDFPARFESPSGLSVQVNANGSIRRMDHRDVILNLFLGSEVEGGLANLYLRSHGASIDCVPNRVVQMSWPDSALKA